MSHAISGTELSLDFRVDGRFRQSTKVYTFLLILFLFTQFTFAQEAKAHGENWVYLVQDGHKREERNAQEPQADVEPEPEPVPIEPLHREGDAFVPDGNSTRT